MPKTPRLVRCPNCDKLLPQISVYQCPNCDAVLTANNKDVDLDRFSVMSVDLNDGFESDTRSSINGSRLMGKDRKWGVDVIHGPTIDHGFEDVIIYHQENTAVSRHSGLVLDGRNRENRQVEGFRRAHRTDGIVMENLSRPGYDHESSLLSCNRSNLHGFGNGNCVGEDEYELRNQMSRSYNLIARGKEKVVCVNCEDWHSNASLEMSRMRKQNVYPNRQPYQNRYANASPSMHRQEIGNHGFYPPPQYAPSRVMAQQRAPGPDQDMVYMDNSVEPYQSLNRRQVPASVLPTTYSKKYYGMQKERSFHYYDDSGCSQDYDNGFSEDHNAQLHSRWRGEADSGASGFIRHGPPKVNRKHCIPVAGGAPFFTCCNCFELLLLSKKLIAKNNNRSKIRCGGCHTVTVFAVSNKRLSVSLDNEAADDPITVENKLDLLRTKVDGHWNQIETDFSSDDFEKSGYDIQYMDRELGQVSAGQGSANISVEMKSRRHSVSAYSSEVEEYKDWDGLAAARKDSSLAGKSTKTQGPSPPIASSLQQHNECSNKYHVTKQSEGSRSGHSEREDVLVSTNKSADRHLLKTESSATEIDLSSNEFNNTGTTFDSGEASQERDHLKSSRTAGSFYSSITEESFKDWNSFDTSSEQETASVTVNGHLIPDRLIKKAQKLAGPISPGHYWYDFRAGFWGAIGGPCLGIIPPFIEEFKHPMPEHCAGGNTNVFVNGRELSQKDLKLLVSRGLPAAANRSYIIEISGRVLDDETGEELQSLGKLAPTIERLKRGLGLKMPKSTA